MGPTGESPAFGRVPESILGGESGQLAKDTTRGSGCAVVLLEVAWFRHVKKV